MDFSGEDPCSVYHVLFYKQSADIPLSGVPFFRPKCPPPSAADLILESQLLLLIHGVPQFPHLQNESDHIMAVVCI